MRHRCIAVGLALFVFLIPPVAFVRASFHQWRLTEFFSNADGSVQFVEIYSPSNGEHFAENAEIRSTSTGKFFKFLDDLSTNLTGGKRLLIATSNFASLAGAIAPDYATLPANFFNAAGDTVRLYAPNHGEFHSRVFTSVPTDGKDSRHYEPPTYVTSLTANSPTNFAGAMGQIDLSIPVITGDYNGDDFVDAADFTTWRDNLDGNASVFAAGSRGTGLSGPISSADFDTWKANFGNDYSGGVGSIGDRASAAPEPTSAVLTLFSLLLAFSCARRRH